MLLIVSVILTTSTYAWFAMSNQVTVTGMSVRAQTENGIIISNEDAVSWGNLTDAKYKKAVDLQPTSTADFNAWYYGISDYNLDPKTTQPTENYIILNDLSFDKGIAQTTLIKDDGEKRNVYLVNKFYIKAQTDAPYVFENGKSFLIKRVKVACNADSILLDSALRVGIRFEGDDTNYIFAPIPTSTKSYTVNGTTSVECVADNINVPTAITEIPGVHTDSPLGMSLYLYFEGEDANCKTVNITNVLDNLDISIEMGVTEGEYEKHTVKLDVKDSGLELADGETAEKQVYDGEVAIFRVKGFDNKNYKYSSSEGKVEAYDGIVALGRVLEDKEIILARTAK